ncbi:MAG: hypothetical protein ABIG93_02445 [archaeon]|nr:hypothetical protein [Nanoarchaeota archaeon]
MAAKKATKKQNNDNKHPSWEQIGKTIGGKVEKEFKNGNTNEKCSWHSCWTSKHEEHCGGGLGRLIFIVGLFLLLNYAEILTGIPWWIYVITGFGFTLMKF